MAFEVVPVIQSISDKLEQSKYLCATVTVCVLKSESSVQMMMHFGKTPRLCEIQWLVPVVSLARVKLPPSILLMLDGKEPPPPGPVPPPSPSLRASRISKKFILSTYFCPRLAGEIIKIPGVQLQEQAVYPYVRRLLVGRKPDQIAAVSVSREVLNIISIGNIRNHNNTSLKPFYQ